ncbi:thiamine-binding protein [Methanobrevibacter ruminantium]|nr:thiamine-binding protein [Methanobrevibacter ruminantium]
MITADLCIIPMGIDESSVGKYVAEAAKIIEKSWLEISNNRYGDSN